MSIDYNDLASADEQHLAHFLMSREIKAGSGPVLPRYTDADFEREKEHKEAIRAEFIRRGYSDDEVQQIESGDWTVLDTRNA